MAYTRSVKIYVSGLKRETNSGRTMIKKSCLLFLILITQIHVATDEGRGATVQKAMTPKMAHTLFTEAFNAKNAEQLCALYAEDAVAVNPRREGERRFVRA